jgi:hypothetical protein
MAIGTFAQLKTALAAWADQGTAVDDYLEDIITLSTNMLNYGGANIPALRTREMLETTVLEASYGVCTLPTDYLDYKTVTHLGTRRVPLKQIAQGAADDAYGACPTGIPQAFVVNGDQLRIYPFETNELFVVYLDGNPVYLDGQVVTTEAPDGGSQVELVYYQAIPHLSSSATTNWLLTKKPDIYLHAGLLNLAILRRDADLQAQSASMLTSLMKGMQRSDFAAQYASPVTRLRIAP